MTTAAMTKTMSRAATAKTAITAAAGYFRGSGPLDADALRQELSVVRRIAEKELAGLGPLEVQVGVVFPGEADAAMDLDVLGGSVEIGVGAVRLGQAGHGGQLVVELGCGPACVVRRRLGRLHLEEQVGALVLDG